MGLLDQAREDWKAITSDTEGFGSSIKLIAPTGEIAEFTNLHFKINLGIDEIGLRVNAKKAHISFSESQVYDSNPAYVLRNAQGEVNMAKHRVVVADSTGLDKNYVVSECFPDESLGVIVLILGDYE